MIQGDANKIIVVDGEAIESELNGESIRISKSYDGDADFTISDDGTFSIQKSIEGESGMVEQVHIEGNYYSGPTSVTPTREAQILNTSGKTLTANITVNPIPPNYGLITWDGRKITVS